MKELWDRIIADGEVFGSDVLKVDSFLNHQIDANFIMQIGQKLASRFCKDGITKILTIESSGIAVAMAVGLELNVPVVFAKKSRAVTQKGNVFSSTVFSYTRKESMQIMVSEKYLSKIDNILIIDDFLAHGEALAGLVNIINQAGAKLVGAGIVIEKRFQHGGDKLRASGVRIESLAAIESMSAGKIVFCQ